MDRRKDLYIWTIYKHPKDYPDKFVCRIWNYDKPTDKVYLADSLEEIRRNVPEGLCRIERLPQDDPCIVEIWI